MNQEPEPEPEAWLTVKDAAIVAKRPLRTIYSWIAAGRLRTRIGPDNVMRVRGKDMLSVGDSVPMGRPKGSARPSGYN